MFKYCGPHGYKVRISRRIKQALTTALSLNFNDMGKSDIYNHLYTSLVRLFVHIKISLNAPVVSELSTISTQPTITAIRLKFHNLLIIRSRSTTS